MTGREVRERYGRWVFNVWRNGHFAFARAMHERSGISTISIQPLPTRGVVKLSNLRRPKRCSTMSCCGLNFCFPGNRWHGASLRVPVCQPCIFCNDTSVQIFLPFLLGCLHSDDWLCLFWMQVGLCVPDASLWSDAICTDLLPVWTWIFILSIVYFKEQRFFTLVKPVINFF